jgi:hypothetical protein
MPSGTAEPVLVTHLRNIAIPQAFSQSATRLAEEADMRRAAFVLLGVFIAGTGSALAQSPPSPAPDECSARGNAPRLGEERGKALGDRLAESKGVICPPRGVDPQMAAPPPAEGNTPVIRPPGTPGGDQSIQPK